MVIVISAIVVTLETIPETAATEMSERVETTLEREGTGIPAPERNGVRVFSILA